MEAVAATGALCIPVTGVDLGQQDETNAKQNTGRVLVVTDDNHVQKRDVTVGLETANRVEIRSGLRAGEMVVVGNRAGLQQGQMVKPKVVSLIAEEKAGDK